MNRTDNAELSGCIRVLSRILAKQAAASRKLGAALIAQTEALVTNDCLRIERHSAEAEALARSIAEMEPARIKAAAELANVIGPFDTDSNTELTLKRIAECLPPKAAADLLNSAAGIRNAEAEIARATEQSRNAINVGLDYVRFTFELITRSAVKPRAYGNAAAPTPSFYLNQRA